MTAIPVPRVPATEDPDRMIQTLRKAGSLVVEGLLSRDQVRDLNHELDKPLEATTSGSKHNVD